MACWRGSVGPKEDKGQRPRILAEVRRRGLLRLRLRGMWQDSVVRRCCCYLMAFAAVVLQSASTAGRGGSFGLRAVVVGVGVRGGGEGVLALSFSATTSRSSRDERPSEASTLPLRPRRIAVVGGGASGIFAAIAAASSSTSSSSSSSSFASADSCGLEVTVLEATSKTLQKVKVSGGGRCNVLHDHNLPLRDYVASYPRGRQPLQGLFAAKRSPSTTKTARKTTGFGPREAKEWFESRRVRLKTERDGRMFPVTDSSQTVMDCLLRECQALGVTIKTGSKVVGVRWGGQSPTMAEPSASRRSFLVDVVERRRRGRDAEVLGENEAVSDAPPQTHEFDALILATGSAPVGHRIASNLGHLVVPPVPSLFTLSTLQDVQPGGLLHGLAGLSLARAQVSFDPEATSTAAPEAAPSPSPPAKQKRKKAKRLEQEGPLLITHHGLSGPAALRLSAFGAIELNRLTYRTPLRVHWAPAFGTRDEIFEELWRQTVLQPKKLVRTVCPLAIDDEDDTVTDNGESDANGAGTASAIPKRLWAALVEKSGLSDKTWAEAGKRLVRDLATRIAETELAMTGKGTFKEEFVTAGGIDLKQVDTRTMQSKIVPGLFACGECLNVDGVTGGFNFMNAWSTGYVAGSSAADFVMASCHTMTADQETDT